MSYGGGGRLPWRPGCALQAFQQAGNDSLWLMESQTAENVYYDEDMEEALRKGGVQTSANSKTVEIHMDTLHKKLKQANDGQPAGYWYLNGELAPPDLAAEVTLPEDTLEYSVFDDGERFAHPEALACRLAPNKRRNNKQSRKLCPEEQPAKRMWIGSAGLVACMHYDTCAPANASPVEMRAASRQTAQFQNSLLLSHCACLAAQRVLSCVRSVQHTHRGVRS